MTTSIPFTAGSSSSQAAYLSTLYDIGGIFGGILAGRVADLTQSPALTSIIMLSLTLPGVSHCIQQLSINN